MQIVVSPLLISSIIGFFIYIFNPAILGLVVAIAIIFVGLFIGIFWANRV